MNFGNQYISTDMNDIINSSRQIYVKIYAS